MISVRSIWTDDGAKTTLLAWYVIASLQGCCVAHRASPKPLMRLLVQAHNESLLLYKTKALPLVSTMHMRVCRTTGMTPRVLFNSLFLFNSSQMEKNKKNGLGFGLGLGLGLGLGSSSPRSTATEQRLFSKAWLRSLESALYSCAGVSCTHRAVNAGNLMECQGRVHQSDSGLPVTVAKQSSHL